VFGLAKHEREHGMTVPGNLRQDIIARCLRWAYIHWLRQNAVLASGIARIPLRTGCTCAS
jgi:hypothetical protein